ncbi:COBRA-like protein 8 [Linum perenne]
MPPLSFPLALTVFLFLPLYTISQTTPPTAADAPPSPADSCNGIFLSYRYGSGSKIRPTDPTHQPYRFESTLTVQNNGIDKLKSWQAFVGF